jgi:hypothetical protein
MLGDRFSLGFAEMNGNCETCAVFGSLRCMVCGTKVSCSQAEVMTYVDHDSFPICCGQVMLFYGSDTDTCDWQALTAA